MWRVVGGYWWGYCFFEERGGCWVDVRMIEWVLRFVE